jgi:formate hydrogenlyase subunit 3/multisubunit Na+/H+ antiporter MnhD subunit
MNAAILSGDFINFFIFWEIMTIVSFFLVVFDRNKKAYEAGIKYFIMSGAGALFMLFGIALLYSKTGTLDFNLISENIVNMTTGMRNTILLMFLIGLGVKAGMVPMHTWLPEAHPIAPSPVSALLSGVMIKIALYMMIRVFIGMFGVAEAWRFIICTLGAVTIIVGVVFAMVQHDAKRLLAFHSISQIGYVILGIGVGSILGLTGALFHILNHAVFKGLLFLCIGSVFYRTGAKDLNELGGLAKKMPVTFITCLIASLSISGIPPLNGFASKWLIYQSLVDSGNSMYLFFLIAALFGSALTLASFMKLIYSVFLAPKPSIETKSIKEVDWKMSAPLIILAVLCVGLGVFADTAIKYFIGPVFGFSGVYMSSIVGIGAWNPTLSTFLILLGIGLGVLVYFFNYSGIKISASESYIGGEEYDAEEMGFSGTEFFNTVKSLRPFKTMYASESKRHMDIYFMITDMIYAWSKYVTKKIEMLVDIVYSLLGYLGGWIFGLFSKLHRGVISTYAFWAIFGLAVLLFIFMK